MGPTRRSVLLGMAALAATPPRAARGSRLPAWVEAARVLPVGDDIVVLFEDHRHPMVDLRLSFPVGQWSQHWAPHHSDLAWELLLTDREGDLREQLARQGVRLAVQSGPLASTISATLPLEALSTVTAALGLALVRGRGRVHAGLEGGAIARYQHLEQRPDYLLNRAIARMLYVDGDPRRRSLEPPPQIAEDLGAIDRVRDYVVRTPGRVVGLAGAISEATAREVAPSLLPDAAAAHDQRDVLLLAPAPIETRTDNVLRAPAARGQSTIALVREGLSAHDADLPALLVADQILGNPTAGLLSDALRYRQGLTYDVRTVSVAGRYPLPYSIELQTGDGGVDAARAGMRQVVEDLSRRGLTEDERQLAVRALRSRLERQLAAPADRLDAWMQAQLHGLPTGHPSGALDLAESMDLVALNAFIARFYELGAWREIVVLPGR